MKSEIKIERKGFELGTFNIFKVFYGSDQVEVEYIGQQDEVGEHISEVILITEDFNNLYRNNISEIEDRIKAHYESPNRRGKIIVL